MRDHAVDLLRSAHGSSAENNHNNCLQRKSPSDFFSAIRIGQMQNVYNGNAARSNADANAFTPQKVRKPDSSAPANGEIRIEQKHSMASTSQPPSKPAMTGAAKGIAFFIIGTCLSDRIGIFQN